MRRFLFVTLAAACAALPLDRAGAASQDFSLVNRTGYQIDEVYVSTVSNNQWGNDIMGRNALADGQTVNITFSAPSDACAWDLKVKYNDGDEATWRGVNLCSISKVTLFWDRQNQTTRATAE